MRGFRNAYMSIAVSHINPNPSLSFLPTSGSYPTFNLNLNHPFLRNAPFASFTKPLSSSSSSSSSVASTMDAQFENFRSHLHDSSHLRERIRNVALDIDSSARIMHANLLLVHQSRPITEVLEKANTQIALIKEHFSRLAEIVKECPGQYYRYHNDWRTETQTVVSLLTFMHWLDTGSLLMHHDAQHKLGLNTPDFGLDIEDYLVGVCFMSNELTRVMLDTCQGVKYLEKNSHTDTVSPRYVVNRVTYGDYDSPRKVLDFLTELHAAFRMLNLRNDFLRKKFDGMKYDLKRVEEVYYDVKIRGLSDKADSAKDQGVEAQP